MAATAEPLILASASTARARMLEAAGVVFTIEPAAIDEACIKVAAREAGQIVPLQTIVDRVQKEFTGTLVSVEFEDDDGRFIYKVKLLTPAGAIVKLEYDARDGRLLRVKGRGAEAARR